MRLSQTSRVIVVAVLLLAVTAAVWWGLGYPLGARLLDGAAAWRRGFAFGSTGLVRLFALALTVPVTLAIVGSAPAQVRWLALAAAALGAVLLYGDRSAGDVLAVVLFVFAVAAVSESSGAPQLVAALAVGTVVAFASVMDLPLATAEKAIAIAVRATFFYAPLLLGPTYLERFALRHLGK